MATIASLLVVMGMDTKALTAGTAKAESSLAGLGVSAKTLGSVVPLAAAAAGVAVIKFGADAVSAASDLNESVNKVNVVFGEGAGEIKEWASTTSTSIGISEQAALEAAGTFGNLFDAMGLAQSAGTEMSTTLVDLAADLASFNNASPEDVLAAMQSGLTGQIRPLRQYGIEISEAALQQEALAQGIEMSTSEMTLGQKVQLRYALILKQTGNAQGDFARTSDDLANQQRIMAAQWEDLQATLGQILIPVILSITHMLNDLGTVLLFVTGQTESFDQAVQDAAISLGEAELHVAGWVTGLLGHIPIISQAVSVYDEWRAGQDALHASMGLTQDQLDTLNVAFSEGDPAITGFSDAVKLMTMDFLNLSEVAPETRKHLQHLTEDVPKVAKAFRDTRDALIAEIPALRGVATTYRETFTLTPGELRKIADTWARIAKTIAQDLQTLADSDLKPRMRDAIAALPPEMRHAWAEGNDKQRAAIQQSIQKTFTFEDAVPTLARQALTGGTVVGVRAMDGMQQGILSRADHVAAVAAAAVTNIIKKMNEAAESGSPSRKTARLGRDLMTGLANGISDAEEAALKAAQKAIEATIKEIEKRIDSVSSALDKIKSKASAFRDTIAGGISGFGDLAGAFTSAQGEEGGMPLSAVIAAQVSQAQQMADVLEALKRQGASQALLAQAAGDIGFGQALLQGGPAQIEQANQALKDIAKFARDTGKGLTEDFFGKSIDKVTAKLDVLHEDLKAANQQDKVIVNIQGWVGNDQDIAKRIRDELVKLGKRNVTTGI